MPRPLLNNNVSQQRPIEGNTMQPESFFKLFDTREWFIFY